MSCFDNFITIKNTCGSTASDSGFYIEDGGVTLKEASDYVTSDYVSAEAFINSKIAFAINLINQSVYQHFSSKIKTASVIENESIGFILPNKEIVAEQTNKYIGISLELTNNNSFLALHISSISLFVNYSGTVSVKIYDVYQNKLLDTITVTAIAGQVVQIPLLKEYFTDRKNMQLAIVYDSTGIPSYQTSVNPNYIVGCSNCSKNNNSYSNRFVYAKPIVVSTGSDIINANLESTSYTGGLSVNYSVNCNYKSWLCSIKNMLAIPILYKACEEIMNFAIESTDRGNMKTFDVEKLKERRANYESKSNKDLDNILQNISLPNDKDCFSCNIKSKNAIILP